MKTTMQYVNLGPSGLRVSAICVGCMSYGDAGPDSWMIGEEEAHPILNYCYEKGINFFDTANGYAYGTSEEILGRAIKKYGWRRENIVVATKLYFPVARKGENPGPMSREERDNAGYANQYGLSRKHIFDSVDASLKRLDLEYIDLLQIHRADPNVPFKETMEALHDLIKAGKVRYIGASSMWAYQLLEYQYTARMNGFTEFITMQNLYNAIYREEEREMYPLCQKLGLGVMPWSPVAMGWLARPWAAFTETKRGKDQGAGFLGFEATEADKRINEKIEEISKARNVSMAIVSMAWCYSKPYVTSPILGMSSEKRVDEAIESMNFKLTDEEISSIDELYAPKKVIEQV